MKIWALGLFAALGLGPTVAHGVPIIFSFSGTIISVSSQLTSAIAVGQVASGSFRLDSATADGDGSPSSGLYGGISDLTVSFGAYTASSPGGTSSDRLTVQNGSPDVFEMQSTTIEGPLIGAAHPANFSIRFEDTHGAAWSSDAIPTVFDLEQLEVRALTLHFVDSGPRRAVAFITSSTITVPEPGALGLLALGALGVIGRRARAVSVR